MKAKKIITALASYGMSGRIFHGPFLKVHKGFELSHILERSKNESKALFPDSSIVTSYDSILKNRSVDLVIVNTPDSLHYDMAMAALKAGKHVVVEKPMVLEIEESESLIKYARKVGKVLTVYQNRRWDSDFLTLQDLLENGNLGTIMEFESHFDRYKDKVSPDSWKESHDLGTGVLYNLGTHMVDQALQLFGFPRAIFADLEKLRPDTRVTDYYHIHLYYEGFKAILKCSYQACNHDLKYLLHTSRGSFIKTGADPQEMALDSGQLPLGDLWGQEDPSIYGNLTTKGGTEVIPSKPGNYMKFYENLYQVITSNGPLEVRPEEVHDVLLVIKMAEQSHMTGRVIRMDELPRIPKV